MLIIKVARFYTPSEIRYEDMEMPTIAADELLIKLHVCGLCGTDIHKVIASLVAPGTVLGHEIAGEIVAVGEEIRNYIVGDRVYVAHHVPCFTCRQCQRRNYTLCTQFKSTNVVPGGFAEYIKIPALHVKHTIGKLPDNMTYEQGAMVEPVACCLYGLNKLKFNPGDRVLIIGAGQIGIIQLQLLKNKLLDKIFVSDINDFRLQQAVEFGADIVINNQKVDLKQVIAEQTDGYGVDYVIISAGSAHLLPIAMDTLARGGTVLVFAAFNERDVAINGKRFFEDEIKIIGSYSSTPYNYEEAKLLIQNNTVHVEKMITHRFNLSQLLEAIECATSPEGRALKVVLHP